MRFRFHIVAFAVLVCAFAAQQGVSDVLAREVAQPGSLVRLLPSRVNDAFLTVSAQRLLAARDVFARGDWNDARRALDSLAPTRDRAALEGLYAEHQGDRQGAISAYLKADDFAGLERIVSRIDASGDARGALTLQRTIVDRLEHNRTQPDALAAGWWRLGQLSAELGYQDHRKQKIYQGQALAAYERAVALAPLSQTYLINAAYQAFDVGDLDRASFFFTRAHDADPKSINALVGLGRIAYLRGNRALAHTYLVSARGIDPTLPDVLRLARQLHE